MGDAVDGYEPTNTSRWTSGELEARLVTRLGGLFRKKQVPYVALSIGGGVPVHLMLEELRDFVAGGAPIIESGPAEPVVFLARPDAAAPSSRAAEQLVGVPADAVAVLPADAPAPIAVLSPDVVASLGRWAETLDV